MNIDSSISIFIFLLMFAALLVGRLPVYQVFVGASVAFLLTGAADLDIFIAGYFNETILTIGLLFMIVACIENDALFKNLLSKLLGVQKDLKMITIRLAAGISGLSAFFNNIPLVLLSTTFVKKWADEHDIPASKLLIPVSYAAIFGGMCTLIGSSTNLIVNSMIGQAGYDGLGMFELAFVGVPCLVIGMAYLAWAGPRLLPDYPIEREDLLPKEQSLDTPGGRRTIKLIIFFLMIFSVSFQLVTMLEAALATLFVLLLTRSMTLGEAVKTVNWQLLVIIGSSMVIAQSLTKTGAAGLVADRIGRYGELGPYLLLIVVYLLTNVMTEFITNHAAAVFTFPIAHAVSEGMSVSLEPFAVAIIIAASASFSTPIGYQTNLIVYQIGRYKMTDFLKIGVPLNVLIMVTAICVIPLVWKF